MCRKSGRGTSSPRHDHAIVLVTVRGAGTNFEDTAQDPSEDDDLDCEPAKLTEEVALARAMAISEAEECVKWEGLEEAIRRSQQVTAPTPTAAASSSRGQCVATATGLQ
jgi:hypothetical protein